MKNIFKMMGLALVAGALLFTACKKDEENTNDTTPETPAIADGFHVTFDGNAWTPTAQNVMAIESYEAVRVEGHVGENYMPMVDLISYQYGVSEGHGTAATTGEYAGFTGEDDEIYELNYYDATALFSVDETGETTYYGDWWIKEGTFSITAFDANALTMTAECNATMFDAMAAFVNQTATIATAPTKALKVTLGKVEFQQM